MAGGFEGSRGDEGAGVVVYFRKEGRALGEVTKYLVCVVFLTPSLFKPFPYFLLLLTPK